MVVSFLFFITGSTTTAQIKNVADTTINKKQDRKFAAGVTLIGNAEYSLFQRKSPLTVNLRYAFQNKHTLRMKMPIARNEKIFGDSNGQFFPVYNTPQELATGILEGDVNTSSYDLIRDNKYDLTGIFLGYDYSYPLVDKLSVYAGFEIGFYRMKTFTKYEEVSYSISMEKTYLSSVTFGTTKIRTDNISIKPLIGLRYQFQRLLIEGAIEYDFVRQKFRRFDEFITYYCTADITETKTLNNIFPPRNMNQFNYSVNLLYIF